MSESNTPPITTVPTPISSTSSTSTPTTTQTPTQTPSSDWTPFIVAGIVVVGYALIFTAYWYTAKYVNEVANTKSTTNSISMWSSFLALTSMMFLLFWVYKIYKFFTSSDPILGVDHIYFIIAMAFYFFVSIGIITNVGFKWFLIVIFVLSILIILPFIFKKIFDRDKSPTPGLADGNVFTSVLLPFYTSYGFLFSAIIIALLVIYTNVTKFNVPNIGTWQLWATIASIIFGIRYIFFYKFSYSNMFTIFGFLGLISFLVFLMIQPTPISQVTLTLIYSLACLLFAMMIPMNIPYLAMGLFIAAITLSVSLGLLTNRMNFSTVQVLFAICALYLVIHFSNSIQYDPKKSSMSNVVATDFGSNNKNSLMTFGLYVIIWAVVTTLYFTDLDNTNQTSTPNSEIMGFSVAMLIVPIFVIFMLFLKNISSGGAWVGILVTLVGLLLMTYYLLSAKYNSHLNYSIVFLILFFIGYTMILMTYSVKNIASMILFMFVLFLPILFIYLFNTSNSKDWPKITGGFITMIAWVAVSILFWYSSGVTFESLFEISSLSVIISCFLLYLVFYYVYLTFTSKKSWSQQFSQIVLIIMFAYLFLKIFKQSKIASNPIVSFFINVVEYIPCMYDNLVSRIMNLKPDPNMKEDFTYNSTGTMIISAIVVFVIGYYFYPTLSKWFVETTHTPGKTLVGDTPFSTNETHLIKTYEELMGDPKKPLYNYGISFDLYISPSSGNDTFYNIVNFSGNLFVTYNTDKNQLYIYSLGDDGGEEPPQVALYRYNQFPLQKWVKIEINYVGGIYDVFVDKKLKTSNNVVSYKSYGNIYVGEAGSSVNGKVKDFIYYEKPLSMFQVKNTQ